jgi:CHAT domain-containing protein/Tfp pilus assembly protein PilF
MANEVLCILQLICDRKSPFVPHLSCFLTLLLSSTFLVKADADTSYHLTRPGRAAAQSPDTRPLELRVPIERALASGESHSYQIALTADQYLELEVAQRGVDVVVTVFDPAGTKLTETDNAKSNQGSELLAFIAEASGNYRVQIGMAERNAPVGQYEVKVIALRSPTAAERSLEEARRLSEESRNLRRKGKYDEALLLAERALVIREKILGPEHREVADSLHALASLYDDKSDYAKAEPLNLRALAIREKVLGPNHPDVAKTLNNLAWIYGVREDYAKAERFYRRALAIQEKALGANHPEVASTLNDLALLYYEKGDYDQSILTNQRVLAIREEMLGPDDSGVAKALNNLALVYLKKGDYAKAEALYQHALQIWEKALGPDHPLVATVLHNLARVYLESGKYAQAEPLYQRALTIREKALGPDHLDVAMSLNNLGMLYDRKGDYAQAERLHLRALEIQEKRLGLEHPYVAVTLTNLARVYENLGNYEKAEPLYQRALIIREKALGPTHPDVGESLNNLGQLYLKSRKDDARAESLFQRSLEVMEKALGSDYAGVAVPLSNLGAVHERKGDDVRAEQYYQRALTIREGALGLNHPDVALSLDSLARLYRRRGDIQKALAFLSRSNEVRERSLSHNLTLGSERQKLDYLKLFSADMDEALSLHSQLAPRDTRALQLGFTILLRRKGRALDAMTDSIASLRSRSNPQDRALFNQLFEARSRLAGTALRGPDKNNAATYPAQLKELEDQVDKLEAEVSERSGEFRALSKPITLEAIRALLPKGTALIEFAFYRIGDAKTDSQKQSRYAAYLLVSGGPAQWVDLGEAGPIDRAVAAWRRALRDPQRADAKTLARALDEKVMQPVRALLGPTQHLLVSADGSLNVIPFAALVDEQDHYLVERFSISYLTSGRDLMRLQVARNSRTGPVVVADPAFGEPATIPSRRDGPQTSKQGGSETVGRAQIDYSQLFFGPLPGVADEVRALKELLPQASFLTKERATKAALKQVRGPSILHIATHGFFLQDLPSDTASAPASEREKVNGETRLGKWAVWTENPLLRSGLALAGANQGRTDDDNGVLTALETSGLDLWGTKLVVLSACDTGLGEVKSGEGVYGLRRALVLAGAESQMMSLWPVSDRSTSDLMVGYYKALIRGQGRDEALRQVQLQMLRGKSRAHPYYWASFIQSGEWANLEGKR